MKYLKILLLTISVLVLASCTTFTGVYSDDVYYTPGDNVIILKHKKTDPKTTAILMQIEDEDTTLTYLDDYEINYLTKIKTFYSPFMYDPFWDPYWSIDYGFNNFRFGFGYSSYPFYYPHYSSYYYPYWHYNFYDPWYNYGYNYNNWYGNGGYGAYENHNNYNNYNNHQKYKGKQDYRRSDAVRYERKNDKNEKQKNNIRSNSSTGRNYTPTYTRPRLNTSPDYNGSTRQYSDPQRSNNTRVQPSSVDNKNSTPTRGSYQRSIDSRSSTPTRNYTPSNSQSTRNYSAPNNNSSSSNNFSSPSRSYSSPSPTNSGGGNSGGNSGGSTGTRGGR